MSLYVPIITISLAIYGWFLITRLAKRREAHDLYFFSISLFEQLEVDGRDAWKDAPLILDEYTENKLLSKIAAVEQRLGLIKKHYNSLKNHGEITTQIRNLRIRLTTAADALPDEEPRSVAIHRLTTTLISTLLEENYAHLNKRPWFLP